MSLTSPVSFTSIVTSVPTAISLNMRLSGLRLKLFSSRRRQRHPGLAVIYRGDRAGDEARRLAGLSFRTDIYNHVAFVDPERQFITDFWNALAVANGRRLSQRKRGSRGRPNGIGAGP